VIWGVKFGGWKPWNNSRGYLGSGVWSLEFDNLERVPEFIWDLKGQIWGLATLK